MSRLRYGRIIIMTTRMWMVLYSHLLLTSLPAMPELVRAARLHIACPPLYKIKRKKREDYVDDDAALNRFSSTSAD